MVATRAALRPASVFEADCALTGVSGDSASDAIAIGEGTIPTSSGRLIEALAYRWIARRGRSGPCRAA